MGVDIHMKTYVWSKVENKYIDAYNLCDNLSIMMREFHDGEFPEFVGDRYYNLFDLFGSGRNGSYEELTCLNGGIPDFIKDTTFGHLISSKDSDYYGFSWCYYKKFKRELIEYKKALSDPERYLDHDSDIYNDWKENPEDEEVKAFISEYQETNNYLITELDNILRKLKFYDVLKANDNNSYESSIGKLIDVDKTIFMFWFDN